MGKWATYQKRGSARQQGSQSPLSSGGWSITGVLATQFNAHRLAGFPAGADGVQGRARLTAGGPWILGTVAATDSVISGLTTATNYSVQIAWTSGGNVVSGWSDVKTQTTA